MFFRQLFDAESATYTYLIADEETKEAALIDSVDTQFERDRDYIEEMGLQLKYLLETHVHADHITGIHQHKSYFKEALSAVHLSGKAECADLQLEGGETLSLGALSIQVIATPGHTACGVCFSVEDKLFTGDTLFIRGCGRTDFQGGSADALYDSVSQKLFTLSDETKVYPGHDYKGRTETTIGEEKQFNPRLNKGREAFVEIMNNLNLAYPKKIDQAVPANRKCGKL